MHGKVRIRNKYNFIDLGFVHATWTLEENGKTDTERRRAARKRLRPAQAREVALDLKQPAADAGRGVFPHCQLRAGAGELRGRRRATSLAWDQFKVPFKAPPAAARKTDNLPAVKLERGSG